MASVDGKDRQPATARGGKGVADFPRLTLEEVLSRFERVTQQAGYWIASCPCPNHGKGNGDQNPSLSISVGEDGKLLLRCHAGCSQDDVITHSGLGRPLPTITDVDSYAPPAPAVTAPRSLTAGEAGRRDKANQAVLAGLGLTDAHRRHLRGRGLTDEDIDLAGYRSNGEGLLIPFRDPEGRVLGVQVRPDSGQPKYKWLEAGTPAKAVPHAPLACSDLRRTTVRITEGGLKADVVAALEKQKGGGRVRTVGVAGVTNWEAAIPLLKQWRHKVQTVRLAFDQDEAGRKAAREMAARCQKLEWAVEVEVWDEAHKGLDDALKAGAEVRVLTGEEAKKALGSGKAAGRVRRFLSMTELMNLPSPQWLIDNFLQENTLAVLAGASGAGKSFVALDMAASVALGRPWLGKYKVRQGPVLYLAAEGGVGMKKRVLAWCSFHQLTGVPEGLHLCPDAFNFKDPDGTEREALLAAVGASGVKNPALLVVDTIVDPENWATS